MRFQFIKSAALWFFVFLPVVLVGFVVVPFMLRTKWDGKTTWWGNFKYGRGDTHYKKPSKGIFWRQWMFLCLRNPASNFGKRVLSVKDAPWVWLYDAHVIGNLYWKFGWKDPVPENDYLRTFVFRPWFHDAKGS